MSKTNTFSCKSNDYFVKCTSGKLKVCNFYFKGGEGKAPLEFWQLLGKCSSNSSLLLTVN